MKDFTLREKVGQMLIIKIFGKDISEETMKIIRDYKIGGVILYRKNYDNYEEMLNIINELKRVNKESGNIPLFISIDQEGGRVNRMPYELKNIKSAGKLIKKNDIELIRDAARITAQMLRGSGFNMNYAPVLDIQRFEDSHAIGDRCYGKNEEEVSKNGIEVMKELAKGKVIPVIKHFPGHGSTTKDSHFFLPVIDKSFEKIEESDIIPFKRAIGQNAEAIMVGHLMIKDIDSKNPASLSEKIINGYLRNKCQYKGIIMTDDIKMRAISLRYGYIKASIRASKAGADIIMVGASYNTIIRIIKKLEKNILKNKINIEQVNKSFERIIKLKEKYEITDEKVEGINIDETNKKIEEINEKILEENNIML